MPTLKEKSLKRLLKRRTALQARLDELSAGPTAYSIQGSVSVTNPKIEEIQKQLDILDEKIASLLDPPEHGGIRRTYPVYRPYCH